MYLHQLAQYLGHFAAVRWCWPCSQGPATPTMSWSVLSGALGLDHPATEGDKVRAHPGRADAHPRGVVDYVSPWPSASAPTTGCTGSRGFDGSVAVGHHLFSDVDPEAAERAWQTWLSRVFEAS